MSQLEQVTSYMYINKYKINKKTSADEIWAHIESLNIAMTGVEM
jgi:hypothetical protein